MGGKSSSKSSSSTTQNTTSTIGDTTSLNIEFGSSTFNTGHLETTRLASTSPSTSQDAQLYSTTSQRADSSATGATASFPLMGGGIGGAVGDTGGSMLGDLAGLAQAGLGAYGSYQAAKAAGSTSFYDTSGGGGYYESGTSSSGSSLLPVLAIGGAGLALIYFMT